MNPRTTVVLLIAALLLGALVYVYEIRETAPAGGDESSRDQLFQGIEAADVEWIEVSTTDGKRVRAERSADGWRIVAPDGLVADPVAFDALASRLVDLDVAGRVTGNASVADFGVGDEVEPVRFAAAGNLYALRIGGRTPVGSNTYVRADDDSVAWVDTWRTNSLRKSLTDLRDRRVIDFDHGAVERIEVQWPDGSVVIEKSGQDWTLVAPVAERADRATVETLLSDLAFLNADGFIDGKLSDDELGLGQPALRISLAGGGVLGGGFEREVAFGALLTDGRVVRGPDGGLFVIDALRLDELPRELIAYRFKTLADFDLAEARALTLTFDGPDGRSVVESKLADGRWQTSAEIADDERVRALVTTLARLFAESIVADEMGAEELAVLGLDPARMRAVVTGASGEVLADVSFGVNQTGSGLIAQRDDSPIVYRIAENDATRIPANRSDFDARIADAGDPLSDADAPAAEDLDPEVEPSSR